MLCVILEEERWIIMEQGKMISFYKSDFTDDAWEIICDEFDVSYEEESIICVVDLSTIEC